MEWDKADTAHQAAEDGDYDTASQLLTELGAPQSDQHEDEEEPVPMPLGEDTEKS